MHAPSEPEAVAASDTTKGAGAEARDGGELAHTGSGGLGVAAPLGVGMLAGGYVLYRRSRVAGRR
ncbi:hypothetical protein [Streptomyces smyrnaeus]|uniref:hypothetical protein n=1 Tax=Streptomyces smyrnaeus TaxID=1387713 RepID=UPI00368F05D2